MSARAKKSESELLHVGVKSHVIAFDKKDGRLVWSAKLQRKSDLVVLIVEEARVFACSGGELSCLDAKTGALVWHNRLKGYGHGWASIAGSSSAAATAAAASAQAAATAAMIPAVVAATSA